MGPLLCPPRGGTNAPAASQVSIATGSSAERTVSGAMPDLVSTTTLDPTPNPDVAYDHGNWDNLAVTLKSGDKRKIENWNAAIDTLLVLVSFI